jgi:uncharacterized protein (TIGR02453 family)
MSDTFQGFPKEGLQFLADLKENNDREWFTPRKQIFEETLRQPMLALVGELHREMLAFAPQYVGEPAKCLFRIYRDTRFSKDKTPYKDHIAAQMRRNDLKQGAGYYLGLSATEMEIGGGLWMPEPEVLLAVRTRIAADHKAFERTFPDPELLQELFVQSATRPPKGFDPAHPGIELLKRKNYVYGANLAPTVALGPGLKDEILKRFAAMVGFLEFLNGAVAGVPVTTAPKRPR